MTKMAKPAHLLILALAACLLGGCGATSRDEKLPVAAAPSTPVAKPVKRVTDRPADTDGQVFVIEYHKIAKEEARWDRSIDRYKKDLQKLYDLGFRPVTLTEYVEDRMALPPGASPIVFTFDDSHISQFRFLEDGSIAPDCAVGIWLDFAKIHPDFPVKASFYVLPPTPWGQKDSVEKKFAMLKEWGCEVGSHSVTHTSLAKLDDEGVRRELADSSDFVASHGFECKTIALPYGISPKNASLLEGFERGGKRYGFSGALLVGASPAPSPKSAEFNPMRIPRIQCIDGEFGLDYWLDQLAKGNVRPYVAP
ncbi:MAG: polysaccharide deacetylase family protein [Fimbriimonadaceae bacterium]|nr:polysaccharide deacetylase family protein [Fimbriimonadaceae bacterium]